MNKDDKKSITPAYEYKVDGYRYQLMQDIAFLTSENKALNKEKDELRQEIDILKSKVELSGSVAEDIKKLNDSLDYKNKWINSLKEENKSLLMFRNHLFEQLLLARKEIESLKEELGRIRND